MYQRHVGSLGSGLAPNMMLQQPQMPQMPPMMPQMMQAPQMGGQGGGMDMMGGLGLLAPMLMGGMKGGSAPGLFAPGGLLSQFSSDPWKNVGAAYNLSNII